MSTVYFIRHGQASFGADNYDVLSELGAEQSHALGRHLVDHGVKLDAIYVGPRERHIDTALHLRNGVLAAGGSLPEPIAEPGLDEYPAFELFKMWLPKLAELDPSLEGVLEKSPEGQRRTMQNALEVISNRWETGELDTGDLETFQDFVARVDESIARIKSQQGRGKRIAVVTSGGPISIAMRLALGLEDGRTLNVAWVIANASVSEFRYRAGDFNLVSFNRTSHLFPTRLLTYR